MSGKSIIHFVKGEIIRVCFAILMSICDDMKDDWQNYASLHIGLLPLNDLVYRFKGIEW